MVAVAATAVCVRGWIVGVAVAVSACTVAVWTIAVCVSGWIVGVAVAVSACTVAVCTMAVWVSGWIVGVGVPVGAGARIAAMAPRLGDPSPTCVKSLPPPGTEGSGRIVPGP